MAKVIEARTGGEGETRTGAPGEVEDLAALAREAGELEADAQREQEQRREVVVQQQQQQQQAAADQAAAEVAALLGLVRTMAAPPVEALGYLKPGQTQQIWTDAVLESAAGPLVAIMERHGVGVADLMQSWGPYALLFVATAVPAMATLKAVRENRAEKAAQDGAQASAEGRPVEGAS